MRVTSGFRSSATALIAVLLTAPAWASAPVQALWAPRHVHFVYEGFTTRYSCSGLRDAIENMLVKLGARDLKVIADPCIRPGGVDPFPGVRASMQVLVPAGANSPPGERIAAHWHKVVLNGGASRFNQGGTCELIEQFSRKILPLFATRNVDVRASCVPHQITMGTYLSALVLLPEGAPPASR